MEGVAAEHLARQAFDVYCPRFQKRRSHAGRVEHIPSPLFPRYLFVAFDPAEPAWRAIRSTRGVVDLVRSGSEPAWIDDGVVAEIRGREDAAGHVVLARQFEPKSGDLVRIEDGAFAQRTAIFTAMKDDERVVALLSLLGRTIEVVLPVTHIAPAR